MMTDTDVPCPECGAKLTFGYGLAGGGMGSYVGCTECDYFRKEQDTEGMEDAEEACSRE